MSKTIATFSATYKNENDVFCSMGNPMYYLHRGMNRFSYVIAIVNR